MYFVIMKRYNVLRNHKLAAFAERKVLSSGGPWEPICYFPNSIYTNINSPRNVSHTVIKVVRKVVFHQYRESGESIANMAPIQRARLLIETCPTTPQPCCL